MNTEKFFRWCFTSWDFNKMMRLKTHLFDVVVVGQEICPTTQQLHFQGYVRSIKAYNLSSIKRIIDSKAHFEPAYAIEDACILYCKKDGRIIISQPAKQEEEDVFDVFNILGPVQATLKCSPNLKGPTISRCKHRC